MIELDNQIQKINLDTTKNPILVEELGDFLECNEFSKAEYEKVATLLLNIYTENSYNEPIKESALNSLGFVYENYHLLNQTTIDKIDDFIIENILIFDKNEYSYIEDMLAYMNNPVKNEILRKINT